MYIIGIEKIYYINDYHKKNEYGFLSDKCGRESPSEIAEGTNRWNCLPNGEFLRQKDRILTESLESLRKHRRGNSFIRRNSQVIDREVWQLFVAILLFYLIN